MDKNFQKFKKRLLGLRVLKAGVAGVSAGALIAGCALILDKQELINIFPTALFFICAGAVFVVFLSVFFALWTSDQRLARKLDAKFNLNEKVQTALAFQNEHGEIYKLQREDAESTLAHVKRRELKPQRLWMYFAVLVLSACVLTLGILLPQKEPYIPPEEIIPFEISEMQIAGIEELIKYVDSSKMEEPYKSDILSALTVLLADLKAAKTEPEMQAALAVALTAITETTYDSSSMTEILNALWSTDDANIKALANALNTSHWKDPDWGDFAEKYEEFRVALTSGITAEEPKASTASKAATEETDEAASTLRWTLENLSRKTNNALALSGIEKDDRLYTSVYQLINGSEEIEGLALISTNHNGAKSEELISAINSTLSAMTNVFYDTICVQKTNTNVGEYTLGRLGMLFSVPIPAFERPDFVKNGEDINKGDQDHDDKENDNPSNSGGIGEGVQFGSDDLVLDPLTGEYVEYGTLYAKYNTLMIEKLGNEKYGYTEEQKKAIEKYFALLYSGFQDEEN